MDPRFITPANGVFLPGAPVKSRKIYGNDLEDFICVLVDYNRRQTNDRKLSLMLPYQTMTTTVVQLFFDVCSYFSLPAEVKYSALEIFDRFVIRHCIELWDYTNDATSDQATKKKLWHQISSRAQKQALLRIFSSIQIASKTTLQSTSLASKQVKEYLNKCGHGYNLKSINCSEIRVFSSLGCKAPLYSVFDYMSVLLEVLQYWTNIEELYPTCEKLLDFTIMQRKEIYLRYFWMGTGRWEPFRQERLLFAEIELDYFLMTSAVVISSLYIHQFESLGPNRASEILGELGHASSNDVRSLAIIITQTVLGTKAVAFTSCN